MIWESELTLEENLLLLFSHVWLFEIHGLLHTRFPVLHYFPEFAQTHVHWVYDAIQPYQPLSSPSPPALNFTSGGQSIGVSASASVLPMNIQCWFPLGMPGLISLQSKGLSRAFSSTTIWKHQIMGTQSSLWSNSQIHMTTGKTTAWTIRILVGKVMSLCLLRCCLGLS